MQAIVQDGDFGHRRHPSLRLAAGAVDRQGHEPGCPWPSSSSTAPQNFSRFSPSSTERFGSATLLMSCWPRRDSADVRRGVPHSSNVCAGRATADRLSGRCRRHARARGEPAFDSRPVPHLRGGAAVERTAAARRATPGVPARAEDVMSQVKSQDGTTIAYARTGSGPALIVVDGALCSRSFGPSAKLSARLAPRFTVYTYDRRGRGQSGDSSPYSPAREVEDIAALISEAGGSASLLGLSSGGALALEACGRPAGRQGGRLRAALRRRHRTARRCGSCGSARPPPRRRKPRRRGDVLHA